jgi:hypothetical protein
MASEKRLSSVCHSIAHHAVSGLSYIHPHLRRACKDAGISSIVIDLKQSDPCPERFREIKPLKLSLAALQKTYERILGAEGFAPSAIDKMTLLFEFTDECRDDYCSNCHAVLVSESGKIIRHSVNYIGQSIAPSNASDAVSLRSEPQS